MARPRRLWLKSLVALVPALLALPSGASPQSGVVGWGAHVFDTRWNDEPFASVHAGGCVTGAIRTNGTAAAWGENDSGQCKIPSLPSGLSYVSLDFAGQSYHHVAGKGHGLGLRSDGSLLAWGDNSYGQSYVPPLPSGVTYTSVSAGSFFSVASRSDGTVIAWGYNVGGQCDVPTPPPGQAFVRVVAGVGHTLGLLGNGGVRAWGVNTYGDCNVPTLPSGLTWLDIAGGDTFSAGVRSDGRVVIWGAGAGVYNVPALAPGVTYTQVRAGVKHLLALRSDGRLVAWGDNSERQCDVPVLPPGTFYVQAEAGGYHSAALRSDGRVVCWGYDGKMQCNLPPLPEGVEYTKLSCSNHYSYCAGNSWHDSFALALRSDGYVDVLGSMNHLPVPPAGLRYVDIAAGWTQALALRSDGAAICYPGTCNIPALPTGVRYIAVSASGGYYILHCGFGMQYDLSRCALLRSDGQVSAAGDGDLGQLWFPTPPAGMHYVQLAVGGVQSFARRSDGAVVCCGVNPGVPSLPAGVTWVEVVTAGGECYEENCQTLTGYSSGHTLGLRSDGQVVAWTYGGASGTAPELIVPPLPPGLVYVQVANLHWVSMARRSDGSIIAWGSNWQGNLDIPVLNPGEVFLDMAVGTFCSMARYGPAPACGSESRSCAPANANSVSANGASLEASGCPGLTSNNLLLTVSGVPPSSFGMFVYGSQQQQVVFGNGWNCLTGNVQPVPPGLMSSPGGSVGLQVDLTQFPFSGSANPILPNSGWFFQYWYRDPASSTAKFNTSDTLHFFFSP